MCLRAPTLRDVYLARQRIMPLARRTPIVEAPRLSDIGNTRIVYKPEGLQTTGSFKIRGAANRLLALSEEQRSLGVVACSSGNHGKAVSYVASRLGIHATICLPDTSPSNKRKAIQELGAQLVIAATYEEASDMAARLQEERGLTMIHPFDDPFVIAGQGTIGLELLEDFPEIDTVLVPLSGGGVDGWYRARPQVCRPHNPHHWDRDGAWCDSRGKPACRQIGGDRGGANAG